MSSNGGKQDDFSDVEGAGWNSLRYQQAWKNTTYRERGTELTLSEHIGVTSFWHCGPVFLDLAATERSGKEVR